MRCALLLLSALVVLAFASAEVASSTPSSPTLVCSLPPAKRLSALASSSLTRLSTLPSPYPSYAEAAFSTYLSSMYDPTRQRLRLQYNSPQPSNYWNSAIAFHTLLHYQDFHSHSNSTAPPTPVVPLVEVLVATQRHLNQSDAELRNLYNDDMSWMVHALTALYDHTRNQSYVDAADLLLATIRQSDDTTCCGDMKGGVWWDLAHSSKATAAQAGVAMAALRLRETSASNFSSDYLLHYAAEHYQFWRVHMLNNATGQVCDSIGKNGQRNWWSFSYNEGLMIGDAVHLYNATHDKAYLADAALLAGFLMRGINVTVNGTRRTILANDCNGGCDNDSSEFHQVGFQYMTEYYRLLVQLAMGGGGAGGGGGGGVGCGVRPVRLPAGEHRQPVAQRPRRRQGQLQLQLGRAFRGQGEGRTAGGDERRPVRLLAVRRSARHDSHHHRGSAAHAVGPFAGAVRWEVSGGC